MNIWIDVPTSEKKPVFHVESHQSTILAGPHSELRALYFDGWVQCQGPEHHLLSVEGVGLRAEAAGGGAGSVEVTSQSRSQERAEDDLGTPKATVRLALSWNRAKRDLPEGGKGQPQEKDKLESVVEREPVDNADEALKNTIDQLA